MHGSDCHDHLRTMVLQTIRVVNSVRIPRATYSEMLTKILANVPLEQSEPQAPVVRIDVVFCVDAVARRRDHVCHPRAVE